MSFSRFDRFLQGHRKVAGDQPLGGDHIDPRLDRMDHLAALTRGVKKGFTPDAFKGITEFTGIVLHVTPKNPLMSPSEDPSRSESPIAATRSSYKQYILKCYVVDGPQSILLPVPSVFSKKDKSINTEQEFILYPKFLYDTRCAETSVIPVVGDMVKLKFNNASYSDGICIRHLKENNFHVLYSIDEKIPSKTQFNNMTSNNVSDYSSTPVPRASPPKWDKPCINSADRKYPPSSLRASGHIKRFIKSRTGFMNIPYDYNKPRGYRKGLPSYNLPAITPAIGYGHILSPMEISSLIYPVQIPIGTPEGENLFRQDMVNKQNKINQLVKVPLTQNQYDALISYYFDMGAVIYNGTRSIIEEINAGNCSSAAKQFLKFGPTLRGIEKDIAIGRRKYEATLFVTPENVPLPIYPGSIAEEQNKSLRNYNSADLQAAQEFMSRSETTSEERSLTEEKIYLGQEQQRPRGIRQTTISAWARRSGLGGQ